LKFVSSRTRLIRTAHAQLKASRQQFLEQEEDKLLPFVSKKTMDRCAPK
jgi:hypothetical protein